jgi:hypothetical protein
MIKKKRKKSKRLYFTEIHEKAIIDYCNTEDRYLKSQLYINYIHPAFDEMVDKIVYTYKFTTLPNIDFLREECKAWLVTILDKYDPNRGSKAFSYFSVITKNWFIHKVKKAIKRSRTEIVIDNITIVEERLVTYNTYVSDRQHEEFFRHLLENVSAWLAEAEKPNDIKVLKAIKTLFEHSNDIEIFNKKAIYLYMREITNLNTKQIASSLSNLRLRYKEFKKDWENGEI